MTLYRRRKPDSQLLARLRRACDAPDKAENDEGGKNFRRPADHATLGASINFASRRD